MSTERIERNARKHLQYLRAESFGNATITTFEVDEDAARMERIRACAQAGRPQRAVTEGRYFRLDVGGELMMSDTPAELRDLRGLEALLTFGGKKHDAGLITGLGLGCAVGVALGLRPEIAVTVIEKSVGVVRMVEPALRAAWPDVRLEIIVDDALTWMPPKYGSWDWAWHDIWPTICSDNLEEMRKLKRRFQRRVLSGQQRCWFEQECRRAKLRGC